MKKVFLLMVLIPFMSPVLAQNDAKKAVKNVEKAVDRGDRDYIDNDRDGRERDWDDKLSKDLQKGNKGNKGYKGNNGNYGNNGRGRPVNPGAHGRANASMKQTTNGKGGYKGNGNRGNNGNGKDGYKGKDLNDSVRDDLWDDNPKGGKNKNKGGKKNQLR